MKSVDEVLRLIPGEKRQTGDGWMCRCPAHNDANGSLHVGVAPNGKILLHCFAGCGFETICAALGIEPRDMFPEDRTAPAPRGWNLDWKTSIAYTYTSRDGATKILQIRRFTHTTDGKATKDFRAMLPDATRRTGWRLAKPGETNRIEALYHWPQVAAAVQAGRDVWLVEGEKDADNLARALGSGEAVTTCRPHRPKTLANEFAGAAHVWIIADGDKPGIKLGAELAADIAAAGVSAVKAFTLPAEVNGKKVKDASDAIDAGWTGDDFRRHAGVAEPIHLRDDQSSGSAGEGARNARDTAADGGPLPELARLIREAIMSEMDDDHRLTADRRRAIVDRVAIGWLRSRGTFYRDVDWRDIPHAMYFDRETKAMRRISSDSFVCWLALQAALPRTSNTWKELQAAVETEAVAGERTVDVRPALYWSRRGGAVYLSCGDGAAVRVTADGPAMVDNGADGVLFAEGRTLAPWNLLPASDARSPLECALFGTMASEDEGAPLLLLLWMLALPMDFSSKPPLVLCGGVGSGKTRTATGIQELFGLPVRTTVVRKNGEDDFWVSLNFGGVAVLDNCDTRTEWLQDAAAAAATNGSKESRRLYRDDELAILRARAALVMTSANPTFATDAGLADRLVIVRLERRQRDTADSALSADIAARRDSALSWIAHTIAAAMRVPGAAPAQVNRRHPDWGAWAWRCAVAMGREAEGVAVLTAAEKRKSQLLVENDLAFGARLLAYFDAGGSDIEDQSLATIMSAKDQNGRAVYLDYSDFDQFDRRRPTVRGVGRHLASAWPHYASVFFAASRMLHGERLYTFRKPLGVDVHIHPVLNPHGTIATSLTVGGLIHPPLEGKKADGQVGQEAQGAGARASARVDAPAHDTPAHDTPAHDTPAHDTRGYGDADPDEMPEEWYEEEMR
jgi:5S rRNA maturation endonuclease (ribonuclease M5)